MPKTFAQLLGVFAATFALQSCDSFPRPVAGSCQIDIALPAAFEHARTTGRVYLVLGQDPDNGARLQRSLGHQPVARGRGVPFFGVDVEAAQPGEVCATFDDQTLGYPMASLRDLPAGEYYVQAIPEYLHALRAVRRSPIVGRNGSLGGAALWVEARKLPQPGY